MRYELNDLQKCASMNLASVFAHLAGWYMVGALSFSPILKIGPIPTPATPGSPTSSEFSGSLDRECFSPALVPRFRREASGFRDR
jgi:hypothetical protein